MDDPSLVSRIYNGLDHRHGYPVIVLTKPIVPVVPVAKRPWWRKLLPFMVLVIMFSCADTPPTFNGLPSDARCGEFTDRMAICVSGTQTYTCVSELSGGCNKDKASGQVNCAPSGPTHQALIDRARRKHQKDSDETTTYLLLSQ